MPYAFLNPDGSIKQVVAKASPFMRLGEGERMVNYNPPAAEEGITVAVPLTPVPTDTLDVKFVVEELPDEIAWATVRTRREALLVSSDWTQLPDVPLATKSAWAQYRQALRDITLQPDPHNITWPQPPNAA